VFNHLRLPIVGEASRKLTQDPDTFLDLPQEQPTPVAGDRSAVKLRPNLASLLGMKSEDKLVTFCAHNAGHLLGRISFQTKEGCTPKK
jgi:hypothetical protein